EAPQVNHARDRQGAAESGRGLVMARGRKWESAVAALLTTPTMEEAARQVGISVRTLRDWLARPGVQRLYPEARPQVLEGAVGRLQQAGNRAVDALLRNLNCDRPAVEIRAAVAVLNEAYRGLEVLDLESELAELRAKLEGRRHGPKAFDASRGGPAA